MSRKLNDLYTQLLSKKLPSAKERGGIRIPGDFSSEDITEFKNFRDNSPEEYNELANEAIDYGLKNNSIPEGSQLDLFATSGPEAFGDLLDSDAVTGMNLQDIGNLDTQFGLTNPEIFPEMVHGLPEVLETMQDSNIQGLEAFSGLSPVLGTAGKLARLYAMLAPALK